MEVLEAQLESNVHIINKKGKMGYINKDIIFILDKLVENNTITKEEYNKAIQLIKKNTL